MEPVLKVENLTKVFTRKGQPDFTAVDHIGFELYPGECLGLIGESGSGKTTAVNMITRLLDPTEGKIILDGDDITAISGRELRRVYAKMQMVFQTPTESFDPRRTLGDGIGESLRNHGRSRKDTKAEVARLLEQCGLPADLAARCSELRRDRGAALSILFICHDIALVQQFCDRVLVMYKGRIVEQGRPDDVIQNPQHDYTKRLIDSIL